MRRWHRQIGSMAELKATSHMLVYTQYVCRLYDEEKKTMIEDSPP